MARGMAIVLLIGLLAGCRAPAPSMSCLTPYMDSTVPPPRTGAVGSNGMYYAPPTNGMMGAPPAAPPAAGTSVAPPPAAGANAPVFTAPNQPLTPPSSYMGSSTTTPEPSTVSLASFQAGRPDEIASSETDELAGAAKPAASDANKLKLNAMPVSDASEPASLPEGVTGSATKDITTAPVANGNAPSFLRFINPRPAGETPATTGAPVQPPASSVAGTWQAR